ncbi:MAG: hypothetical protein J6V44_09980 [Methanobrevibacter sp.]|nr:hypothetical protein [Methanobrevibacter sp.]MBO7695164.1 hypothetical protein [Methanobrevibacter sp.]
MKFKQVDDTKLEALRIKRHRLREEDAGMNKFHMVYTVDGVKSEQDVSAANVMKAEELIRKQYDGKNIIFTSKQPVKENLEEDKIADKIKSKQDPKEMTKRAIRMLKNLGGEYKDLVKEYKDTYGENPLDESLNEDMESPEKVLEADEKVPQTEETVGLSNAIIQEINGEWETIQHYNDLISIMRTEGRDDMVNVISDIIDEENKHIGQLQKCLQLISPNVSEIDSGETEAIGQLDANDNLYADDNCLDCADDDFGPHSGFDIYLV